MSAAVVCGTTFGRIYLQALKRRDQPYTLAGIVARGGARSLALARELDVPLYRSIAELPDDIALGCVVVRAGSVGGAGTEMATQLLQRGIGVVQEHPLTSTELSGLLRLARANRVPYRLSTLYPWLPPVQAFINQVRALTRQERPLFIDAATSVQVGSALIELLGEALGALRPFSFGAPASAPAGNAAMPFCAIAGQIMGVPLQLRLQNQMEPQDPDNYFHIMHRVCIGFASGNLSLHDTHGPVLWTRRFHVPRDESGDQARHEVHGTGPWLDAPRTLKFSSHAPTLRHLLTDTWPAGVARLLRQVHADTGVNPLRNGQRQLDLCQAWEALTRAAGPTQFPPLRQQLADTEADAAERVLHEAWHRFHADSYSMSITPDR